MRCVDRSGQEVSVYENPTGLFRFLYDCAAGRLLLGGLIRPRLSGLAGRFMDSRASRLLIPRFIRSSGIDMREYEEGPFPSFNAFFRRRIRGGARPVCSDAGAVVAPCDGKVQVFAIGEDARFGIKGISYTTEQLLRSGGLAGRYRGGTLMLFRLSVDDYHRYAYPADGTAEDAVRLDGVLHTVDPFAAERRPIYAENSREYTVLHTADLGDVLMMEVGALMVGRIVNLRGAGEVLRGEEKGYFEFGASSILLCFEKDAVVPDGDLLRNTGAGFETAVRLGERVGRAGRSKMKKTENSC